MSRWVQGAVTDAAGNRHTVEVKLYFFDDGTLWWEALRLIQPFYSEPLAHNTAISVILKKNVPTWRELFQELDLPLQDAFRLSKKQFRSRDTEDFCVGEVFFDRAVFGTVGALIALLQWSWARKTIKDRALATSMLEMMVGFGQDATAYNGVLDMITEGQREHAHLCGDMTPSGCCVHAVDVHRLMQGEADVIKSSVTVLRHLMLQTSCPAIARVLRRGLDMIANLISTGSQERGHGDACKVTHQRGRKRKRNLDEDFRSLALHGKQHGTGVEGVLEGDTTLGTSRRKTGVKWMQKTVARDITLCWELHEPGIKGVYSLCQDAARMGCPAEETENFVLWSAEHRIAHWLPVQAPKCNSWPVAVQ